MRRTRDNPGVDNPGELSKYPAPMKTLHYDAGLVHPERVTLADYFISGRISRDVHTTSLD
jgi:hypothetical protein